MKRKFQKKDITKDDPKDAMDQEDNTSKSRGGSKSRQNRSSSKRGERSDGSTVEARPDDMLMALGAHPIGLTRKRVSYSLKAGFEMIAPPVIFRETVPYAAFLGGWSDQQSYDKEVYSELMYPRGVDGKDFLTRTEAVKVNQTLYPLTIFNSELRDKIWPRYNALFQSGLRDTITVSSTQFFRIMGMTTKLFVCLYQLHILHTYAFEIAKKEDLTEGEKIILAFVNQSGLMSARLRNQLKRIMGELDVYPCFPNMIREIRRMLTPFVDPKSPETVLVPIVPLIRETMVKANPVTALRTLLDGFDDDLLTIAGSYPNQISLIKTYIPVTYMTVQAFGMGTIVPDPIRASSWYNSPPVAYNVAGNTGAGFFEPRNGIRVEDFESLHDLESAEYSDEGFTLQLNSGNNLTPYWMTKFEEPIALEALGATIYFVDHDSVGDDEFSLVTPHSLGHYYMIDQQIARTQPVAMALYDNLLLAVTPLPANHIHEEVLRYFLHNKFIPVTEDAELLTLEEGYTQSVLDINSLLIAVRLFAGHSVHLEGVVTLDEAQVGGHIRPRQPGVREAYVK